MVTFRKLILNIVTKYAYKVDVLHTYIKAIKEKLVLHIEQEREKHLETERELYFI